MNTLNAVADMLNDTFNMPADNLSVMDSIIELYKCLKADYLHENVQEVIDDIRDYLLDNEDAL